MYLLLAKYQEHCTMRNLIVASCTFSGCSSGVERNLAKVEVVSSNLITRSISHVNIVKLLFIQANKSVGLNNLFSHITKRKAPVKGREIGLKEAH